MRWMVALLVVMSGCLGASDVVDEAPEAQEPGAPEQIPDVPLTVAIEASVVNGTAPLLVEFLVNVTGNATAWYVDFGDGENSTTMVAQQGALNHTYAAGNFTATAFAVASDGQNASAAVDIVAEALQVAPEPTLEPFEATVDLSAPCPGCKAGTTTCTWRHTGGSSPPDCAWIEFPAELAGHPFTITGTGLDPDGLFWNGGCNENAGMRVSSNLATESGIVPEGASCILVWEALDPLVTVTFSVTIAA